MEVNSQVAESFTILDMNHLGSETFKALCKHSSSLKHLTLLSLEKTALVCLNKLQHCLSLESLELEVDSSACRYPWETARRDVFLGVARWLQGCTELKNLGFIVIPSGTTLLAEVFKSAPNRLLSLRIKTSETTKEFCDSLPQQRCLRHLVVEFTEKGLPGMDNGRPPMLANAIAGCHGLRMLGTNELFNFDEFKTVFDSLPLMEAIVLGGDPIDDIFLEPLKQLSHLKALSI